MLTRNLSTNMYFVDKSHIYLLTLTNVDSQFVKNCNVVTTLRRNDANIILNLPAMTNSSQRKDERRFASGSKHRAQSFSSCCNVPFHPILIGKIWNFYLSYFGAICCKYTLSTNRESALLIKSALL